MQVTLVTLISELRLSKLNMFCISTSDWRTSRYTEPRKFSGTDN